MAGCAAVAGLLVPMLLQHNKNDNNNGKHNDNKQDMHDYVNVGYIKIARHNLCGGVY